MPRTTHWLPKASAPRAMSPGCRTAAELTLTFSAPASSTARMSSRRPDAAAHRKRDEDGFRHPAHDLDHDAAPLVRRRDVVEHDLVRALLVVEAGHFDRVADVDVVLEANALGGAAVADIQAGDDALAEHGYLGVWCLVLGVGCLGNWVFGVWCLSLRPVSPEWPRSGRVEKQVSGRQPRRADFGKRSIQAVCEHCQRPRNAGSRPETPFLIRPGSRCRNSAACAGRAARFFPGGTGSPPGSRGR